MRPLKKKAYSLAASMKAFFTRPGYMHKKYLEFLEAHIDAARNGKDLTPYLAGEFPELSEAQAETIVHWWLGKGNPQPEGGKSGRG